MVSGEWCLYHSPLTTYHAPVPEVPVAARSSANPYGPFLISGSVVLVVAALYLANKVLIPLALAILFTFLLAPVVIWLQKHHIKRVVAVALVVLVTFAVLGGFLWAV